MAQRRGTGAICASLCAGTIMPWAHLGLRHNQLYALSAREAWHQESAQHIADKIRKRRKEGVKEEGIERRDGGRGKGNRSDC